MKINILNDLIHPGRLIHRNTCDNEHFVRYLRSKGCKIGEGTRFISPSKCSIDPGRLDYITIGNNCCLSVVSILAHDYSWYILLDAYGELLPDSGENVVIGNNCFIGYQTCILKGTNIGDNVIIGAKSLVKGNIPSNTVWAGVPAKQVCTLGEFFEKKLKEKVNDANYRKNHIRKVFKRNPTIEEMGLFSVLFLERTEDNYDKYIKNIEFNGIKNNVNIKNYFFNSDPLFKTFDEFLNL